MKTKAKDTKSSKKLEDLINELGRAPSEGGQRFEELCALLLKEMGFYNVYPRRGQEEGRDIDAEYEGETWYFETKRYKEAIDTPKTAYKLLQIDRLKSQPDFFVVMSNVSMKSILKDILEDKSKDEATSYLIVTWTNEPPDNKFNQILLSYPSVYIDFLKKCPEIEIDDTLKDDFLIRSEQYLKESKKFFQKELEIIQYYKKEKKDFNNRQINTQIYFDNLKRFLFDVKEKYIDILLADHTDDIRRMIVELPQSLKEYSEKEYTKRKEITLEKVIGLHSKFVIIGDAGSGKTWALYRLVFEFMKNKDKIPVYISLHRYGKIGILDLIKNSLLSFGWKLEKELLIILLTEGKFALMFDGINEIPYEYKEQAIFELNNIKDEYNENIFIFTCRKRTYNNELRIQIMEMKKLDDKKIQLFLQKYLGSKEGKYLYKRLDRRLKDLARNPLMLFLITIFYRVMGKITRNKGELFYMFIKSKLEWGKLKQKNRVDTYTKIKFLTRLAFEMQVKERVSIDEPTCLDFFNKIMNELEEKELYTISHTTSEIFKEIISNEMLIYENFYIKFWHQSVQEYFAALDLKSIYERKKLYKKILKENKWEEVLVFLSGIVDDSNWIVENLISNKPLLAVKCLLASKCKIDDEIVQKLIDALDLLIKDGEAKDGCLAINALEDLENRYVLKPLVHALDSDIWHVRYLASKVIASKFRTDLSINVIKKLEKGEYGDENKSLWILGQLLGSSKYEERLLDFLILTAKISNQGRIDTLAEALAIRAMDFPEVIPINLIETLLSNRNRWWYTKLVIAQTLGFIRMKRSVAENKKIENMLNMLRKDKNNHVKKCLHFVDEGIFYPLAGEIVNNMYFDIDNDVKKESLEVILDMNKKMTGTSKRKIDSEFIEDLKVVYRLEGNMSKLKELKEIIKNQ